MTVNSTPRPETHGTTEVSHRGAWLSAKQGTASCIPIVARSLGEGAAEAGPHSVQ